MMKNERNISSPWIGARDPTPKPRQGIYDADLREAPQLSKWIEAHEKHPGHAARPVTSITYTFRSKLFYA